MFKLKIMVANLLSLIYHASSFPISHMGLNVGMTISSLNTNVFNLGSYRMHLCTKRCARYGPIWYMINTFLCQFTQYLKNCIVTHQCSKNWSNRLYRSTRRTSMYRSKINRFWSVLRKLQIRYMQGPEPDLAQSVCPGPCTDRFGKHGYTVNTSMRLNIYIVLIEIENHA